MRKLAEPAIEALNERRITVYPDSWRRETIRWLENLHDWNVSRQLWWGQRIPVWYGPDGEVVASKESPGRASSRTGRTGYLVQQRAVAVRDARVARGERGPRYFYPTSLLSTAREIMYLWVARMIMMGLRFRGNVPFEKVNVHSIVLAEDGTKMSKSKGNTIDPLDLFEEYGTDAVRFGLLYQSSTQDFAYSYERAAMGRAFVPSSGTRRALSELPGERRSRRDVRFGPVDPLRVQPHGARVRQAAGGVRVLRGHAPDLRLRLEPVRRLVYRDSQGCTLAATPTCPQASVPRHPQAPAPVMPFATEEMARVMGEDEMLALQRFSVYDPALEDRLASDILERTKECVRVIRSVRSNFHIEGALTAKIVTTSDRQQVETSVVEKLANADLSGVPPRTADYAQAAADVSISFWFQIEQRSASSQGIRSNLAMHESEIERAQRKLQTRNLLSVPRRI
jgi:valyl-tRNA synthetase